LLQCIHRIWVTLGLGAFVGFVAWCLIAYRANEEARAALVSDFRVTVTVADDHWSFIPTGADSGRASVAFLPGALVDPVAYAPLLHAVAARGHPVHLFDLPWRGAFGQADGEDFLKRVRSFFERNPGRWVAAGHSRGAKIAALLARRPPPSMTGLILIGSTHPRDFSLADTRLTVTKMYGTADGIASADDVLANAALLPASTRWVAIEGGNHHQFGYYGFQPGDHFASITRDEQQAATLAAMLSALDAAPPPTD
jgi:pimeloyl-ACP methyl ester carboxylesterase